VFMMQTDYSDPLIGCPSRLSDYDGGDLRSLASYSHGKTNKLNIFLLWTKFSCFNIFVLIG